MALIWEWRPKYTQSKSLTIMQALPVAANTYGDIFIYDRVKPPAIREYVAHGITLGEWQPYYNASLVPNATVSVVDKMGASFTGIMLSFNADLIDGTYEWTASMTIRGTA